MTCAWSRVLQHLRPALLRQEQPHDAQVRPGWVQAHYFRGSERPLGSGRAKAPTCTAHLSGTGLLSGRTTAKKQQLQVETNHVPHLACSLQPLATIAREHIPTFHVVWGWRNSPALLPPVCSDVPPASHRTLHPSAWTECKLRVWAGTPE